MAIALDGHAEYAVDFRDAYHRLIYDLTLGFATSLHGHPGLWPWHPRVGKISEDYKWIQVLDYDQEDVQADQ